MKIMSLVKAARGKNWAAIVLIGNDQNVPTFQGFIVVFVMDHLINNQK